MTAEQIIKMVMALSVCASFTAILIVYMVLPMTANNADIVKIMLGSLGTAFLQVIFSYFPTGKSSA